MGRLTPKSNEAIPVPKDGPILVLFPGNESALSSLSDGAEVSVVLNLLSDARTEGSESLNPTPSQRLWGVLVNASQLRDQLHSLQAYRNTLLYRLKAESDLQYDGKELTATYRLLLEWALSDIPTPLRHAIYSNLDTLSSICGQDAYRIRRRVVESVLAQQHWTNSLSTLFEVLNYEPLREITIDDVELGASVLSLLVSETRALEPCIEEHSYFNREFSPCPQTMISREFASTMATCVMVANILKLFLTPILAASPWTPTKNGRQALATPMERLQDFLWHALTCRGMPSDDLNIIGVTHGQATLFIWGVSADYQDLMIASLAVERVQNVTTDDAIPPLHKLAAIQGFSATLPNEIMVLNSPPIFSGTLAPYVLDQCRNATGVSVRLWALRALRTLMDRCRSFVVLCDDVSLRHVSDLGSDTLNVVLQAWESPPGRQVASAIPGLFHSLIALMRSVSMKLDYASSESSSNCLDGLVTRLLDLPPNRKGRYIALEALLPEVGAKFVMQVAGDELIASLIAGVAGRGHNAVAIADLWGKLLSRLREEMNTNGAIARGSSKRVKQKSKKRQASGDCNGGRSNVDQEDQAVLDLSFTPEWVALWASQLSLALVSGPLNGRKQVAALCIPLIVNITGGPASRFDASIAFSILLEEVQLMLDTENAGQSLESYAGETETLSDRVLWAKFEIARQALKQKVLKPGLNTHRLSQAIAKYLPHSVLASVLTHSLESIRLVAYASIEAVVLSFIPGASHLDRVELEATYWKGALPHAFKGGGREYNKELLRILGVLLGRLLDVKSQVLEQENGNGDQGYPTRSEVDGEKLAVASLPVFDSFVCDFLIMDIIVRQGAYPGTVVDKERFILALFQRILAHTSQGVSTKTPRMHSFTSVRRVLSTLLSSQVMSTLLSLLHSMWDSTRASAYLSLCELVDQAHLYAIPIPKRFSSTVPITFLTNRALYLASSPRQREADTGARMLAFISTLLRLKEARLKHVESIATILSQRLDTIEIFLGINDSSVGLDSGYVSRSITRDGKAQLPMAHGLLRSIRLSIERPSLFLSESDTFHEQLVLTCCRAVRISLAVVSDLNEGARLIDDDLLDDESIPTTAATFSLSSLHGITGAIGANGVFSSVQQVCESHMIQRLSYQRIIVGAWLMTKEACSAISAIITCKKFVPAVDLVERAGSLLLCTLTTLKHQGAAFAAHRALQELAEFCFDHDSGKFIHLPLAWTRWLDNEISSSDRVRDSTLRRSTGYGLAFLAIMRAEKAPKILSPEIMASIVHMSMPQEDEELQKRFGQLRLDSQPRLTQSTSFLKRESTLDPSRVNEASNTWRSRVHALNILRLAILDAPLTHDTQPYIGHAIISSILGYSCDSEWSVRNSATMVFSAAMLRVVDADKNASSSNSTIRGNSITATEFFRRYPPLASFLFSVVSESTSLNEVTRISHSPLFPILLLLSRLQPMLLSSDDALDITDSFIPRIMLCLGHRNSKIRTVAARALANLSSRGAGPSALGNLFKECQRLLSTSMESRRWNSAHGALLGIHYLLATTADPHLVIQSNAQLVNDIYHCVETRCGDGFLFPPLCVSVALKSLSKIAAEGGFDEIYSKSRLEQANFVVVSQLNARRGCIGEARLGAVAAQGLCELCFTKIWDPTVNAMERSTSLSNLTSLLASTNFDLRLEATKACKKQIYREIDSILFRRDVSVESKRDILLQNARAFQAALLSELNLPGRTDQGLAGHTYAAFPDVPTARRLSRCVLECLHALKTQGCVRDLTDSEGESLAANQLWQVALKMLRSEGGSYEATVAHDGENPLCGNAIEHMAFAIHVMLARGNASEDVALASRLALFVRLLSHCNSARSSWKLRHCVAVAIETSGILPLDFSNRNFPDSIQRYQLDLFNESLVLLQDSDPGVRFVVGRAISQTPPHEEPPTSFSSHPMSSQLTLERGYELVGGRYPFGEMCPMLLASLLQSCQGIDQKLDRVNDEMKCSRNPKSPGDLLNLGTERKIFEDELANPFEETLLANHLRVKSLVNSHGRLDPDDGTAQGVIELCDRVLRRLYSHELWSNESNRSPDVAHELTWSNTAFPFIHSLILGSTAIIYLGYGDDNDVSSRARAVCDLIGGTTRESTLHPEIVQSLLTLSCAQAYDARTRAALLRCCFLAQER